MFLARSYSHHSLLSAIPKIPDLIKDAKEKGYTTIALTDEDTGSAFIEFYDECHKQNIKPCLGTTLRIPNNSSTTVRSLRNKSFSKLAILAKNKEGYKSLLKLISIARTQKENPKYHINFEDLNNFLDNSYSKDSFFVLLAGNDHELITSIRLNNLREAENILLKYIENFRTDNLLVELAQNLSEENPKDTKEINQKLAKLCKKHGVKYIASPAPRYLDKNQEEAFRVVLAIRDQLKLKDIILDRDFSLPNIKALKDEYSYLPESLETEEIEKLIDIKIRIDFANNAQEAYFPKFKLEPGQVSDKRLRWETYIGLISRFSSEEKSNKDWKKEFTYEKLEDLITYSKTIIPDTSKLLAYPEDYWNKQPAIDSTTNINLVSDSTGYKFSQNPSEIILKKHKTILDYIDRIEYELDIIFSKGYPEYFLVFGDIMRFCRENGIVTNTRGSAAGSLVGYLNQIVVLDPLIYNLPFERFLNPYRPSPPDIDGDFADDRRDEVINYIKEAYGGEKVSQIITFGTMLPRAVVRDVGRVLGVSYTKCDKLSKLIPIAPQGRKTTFEYAFETSREVSEAYEKDEDSHRIIDIAKIIEGNYRHASSHAAGVIITPTDLTDYAPIQWDSDHQTVVIQYDMVIAEKAGLIKLDILGITNLAILGNAIKIAENRRNQEIDLQNIDIKNQKAFNLLAKGRTMGIFQLSGEAMTRYLVELEPSRVEDLMAMVALYRPGPMASIPEYIERKKKPKKITYIVPQMKNWMEASYGLLVYQDDLLYTAIYLAGYDWGEADKLRKGMGKKIQKVIDEQHTKFIKGCIEHSKINKDTAEYIWSLIVPFGAYGFNKAHSASYGTVAYWTAYMKAEYTVEFMTAYMTSESNNLDKIAEAIAECAELGIRVLPPDINKSFDNFTIEDDNTIRYGLSSVKNLGSDVIKFIINTRENNGSFEDMNDFLERISEFSSFNKRSIEALILAGCLDQLGQKVLEKLR